MTNKYPLTMKEARAALVNAPVGTIVEGRYDPRPTSSFIRLQQWALMDEGHVKSRGRYESDSEWTNWFLRCALPSGVEVSKMAFRIIPLDSPDHPDYVAPQPKLLSAEEALALDSFYIVNPYEPRYKILKPFNKGEQWWFDSTLTIVDLADRKGWPIVATCEEAEQLVKEGK